jgi:hypothetical protein
MILRLQGGLGNQLFQLLAIRYLVNFHKETKYIYAGDLGQFQAKRSLQIHPILSDEIVIDSINVFDKLIFRTKLSRILAPISIHSISNVSQLKNWKSQYLDGYFQDLFSYDDLDLVQTLISDINSALCKTAAPMATIGVKDCAIHLRLTDFVKTEQQKIFLYQYRVPYFKRSIKWFKEQGVRRFILFSDAVEEAKELLKDDDILPFAEVTSRPSTVLEEFTAFASYSNMIASNSTFSFWGSLLGVTKRVVFPEKWSYTNTVDERIFQKNLENHQRFRIGYREIIRL